MSRVLEVENLRVTFPGAGGRVAAVDGVSFGLSRGKRWRSWASRAVARASPA